MTPSLGDKPDESWERFGASDPYYGVLSNARFRGGALDASDREKFFSTGEDHIARVLANAASLFPSTMAFGTALDFGCGVGRLSIPLAKRFEHVVAMDVSRSMLDEAKKNCASAKVENVDLLESDDALTRLEGNVDFIHTYIVLQHIPARRGLRILGALLERLKDGGIAAIDLSLNSDAGPMRRLAGQIKKRFVPVHYLHNILRRRTWNDPLMQTNRYSLNDVVSLLIASGITEYHATIERRGTGIPHDKTIVYCQKSANSRVYP